MKISLRKANAVQGAITEALAGLDLSTEVALNEFEKPDDVITRELERFSVNVNQRNALLAAMFDIRSLVGAANVSAGVSGKLAQLAYIEKDINWLNRLAKVTPTLSREVIIGKLEKIHNRKDDAQAYYVSERGDTVNTSILTEEVIAGFAAKARELKKTKVGLQDELLELNVRTEVELSEATAATLKAAGIV